MKSLLFTLAVVFAISIAIACAPSRSATSPTPPNDVLPQAQASSPTTTHSEHEKPHCALNISSAPVVNGLKLRMTEGDVLALFPGSKDDKELTVQLTKQTEFGNSSFAITPAKYGAKEFAGTNQVSFGLLDDRVTSYTVAYNGPEYPHVDNFVAKFIEGRNLPSAEQWEAQPGLEHQLKVLSCVDFEVRVFAGGAGGSQNYILVTDTEAVKELKDRRKRAREKVSPTPGQ